MSPNSRLHTMRFLNNSEKYEKLDKICNKNFFVPYTVVTIYYTPSVVIGPFETERRCVSHVLCYQLYLYEIRTIIPTDWKKMHVITVLRRRLTVINVTNFSPLVLVTARLSCSSMPRAWTDLACERRRETDERGPV